MRRTISKILVLTIILMYTSAFNVAPVTATEETNLIANPGFESSATEYLPWEFDGPENGLVLETDNKGNAGSANNILITEPGSGTAYIKQTVAVEANTDYVLTCSVQGNGNPTMAGLGVNAADGKPINVAYITPSTDYTTISLKFNSRENTSVVVYGSFKGGADGDTCRFDDFSLTTSSFTIPYDTAMFSRKDWYPGMIFLGSENTASPVTLEMDITPLYVGSSYDATIGYADSSKIVLSHWDNCGVMLRFNTDGYIDARNGGEYSYNGEKIYFSAYKKYHVKFVVDLTSKKYDAYVTPEGGSEVKVADNFAFRTEAQDMDDIGWLSLKSSIDHQFYVENHTMNGTPAGTPKPTPSPRTGPVTLTVGPGKEYPIPQLAFNDAQPGDTIEIYANGEYTGEKAKLDISGKDNIRIVGVPAGVNIRPRMELSINDKPLSNKGIWVVNANNITIENIEFCGASLASTGITDADKRNAAGIRVEPIENLVIRNCYFHDNENGILTAHVDSAITIENCEFARNGYQDYSHNAYIGTKTLYYRYNYSHHAKGGGHLLKTRAEYNYIEYNRLTDEDSSSLYYSNSNIDIPDAGVAYIIGNVMHQSIYGNSRMISYGVENVNNTGRELYVINNTFVNDYSTGTFLQAGKMPFTVVYKNNIFQGPGSITGLAGPKNEGEPNWTGSNNLENANLTFVNKAGYDYRLSEADTAAIDAGADPGASASGYPLTPTRQYAHVCGYVERTVSGSAIDIGAYEYGSVLPTPSIAPSPTPTESPEPSPSPVGQVRPVGPGKQYSNVNAALSAASEGDIIEIYADGSYEDDYAVLRINKSNITFRGVAVGEKQRPVMKVSDSYSSLPGQTAIWFIVSGANNITIDNIEFTGAKDVSNSAAIGIDNESSTIRSVTVKNCYIHHTCNGVYAKDAALLDLIVENCEIAYCGGNASSHNIHARGIKSLTVRGCYLHHVNTGSLIKTFTTRNTIEYNRLSDEGDSSYPAAYNIEMTNGGIAYIIGNVIQQGGTTSNSNMIGYATSNTSTTNYCYIINNTFFNGKNSGAFILANKEGINVVYKNNFFGRGGSFEISGNKEEAGNLHVTNVNNNTFVSRDGLDFRLTRNAADLIDMGVDPGVSFEGYDLMPVKQYTHTGGTADRLVYGSSIDIGAYEYEDKTPPTAITDLTASNPAGTSIDLTWTAPGYGLTNGKVSFYDIRFSVEPITDENWNAATQFTAPAPSDAGTQENLTVTGLTPNTTYYFAIKATKAISDSILLTSAMSNVASATTSGDTAALPAITDLAASDATSNSVKLSWTAPGESEVSAYEAVYSTVPVTEENWASAQQISGMPAPAAAGTVQEVTVSGLLPETTYYFAIKTKDAAGNASTISNVVSCATTKSQESQFIIGSVAFKNLNGDNITSIANEGFITATVRIENASSEASDAALIVALYDSSNAIKNLSCVSKNIYAGQAEEFTAGFNLPQDTTGYYVKVFVWNSLESMVPLCDAVTFQ